MATKEIIEIIKKCRENDHSAQMQVYEKYKNVLYNSSLRIVKNKMDAQDIVHDSFLKGFENIHMLGGDMNLVAWLKRITINLSLNHLKKTSKLKWTDEFHQSSEIHEEKEIDTKILNVNDVMECIDLLKEKYQIIVNLYLIENYSHKEISDFLLLNESTVRNQYARGKAQLKQMLQQKL